MKKVNELLQSITDSIIQDMETCLENVSAINWKSVLHVSGIPYNHDTKVPYTGTNIIILWSSKAKHNFPSNQWLTFKQAVKKGLKIKKGSKSTTIVRCGTFDKKVLNAETGEEEEKNLRFLKTFNVFNLAQTEGYEESQDPSVTEIDQNICDSEDPNLSEAKRIEQYSGADIQRGYNEAYYSPSKDQIFMPNVSQFERPEDYFSVLFHELTHLAGSKNRLNRDKQYHTIEGRAFEELIAELGSAFLCGAAGILDEYSRQSHAKYLSSWIRCLKDDKRNILRAASFASKGYEFIMSEVDKNSNKSKEEQFYQNVA